MKALVGLVTFGLLATTIHADLSRFFSDQPTDFDPDYEDDYEYDDYSGSGARSLGSGLAPPGALSGYGITDLKQDPEEPQDNVEHGLGEYGGDEGSTDSENTDLEKYEGSADSEGPRADLGQYEEEGISIYDGMGEGKAERRDSAEARSPEEGSMFAPNGGIDFSECEEDPETGHCCIMKEEQITKLKKDPVLECTHKRVEQCHYTYVTQFRPSQEQLCEESFEKQCSISFKQRAHNETVEKCYQPLVKVCGDSNRLAGGSSEIEENYIQPQGEYGSERRSRFKKDTLGGKAHKQCKTFFETSCTTRYVEKSPGKFVGETSCEKLPKELCGVGCRMEPGPKECHNKVIVAVVSVPEEVCDLIPLETCHYATKLVPHLSPIHECTMVPKEVCVMKFSTPEEVKQPLLTKWCLDPTLPSSGESYSEENALGQPLGSQQGRKAISGQNNEGPTPTGARVVEERRKAPAQSGYKAPAQSGYKAPSGDLMSETADNSYSPPVTGDGSKDQIDDPDTAYLGPPKSPDSGYSSPKEEKTQDQVASDSYSKPVEEDYAAPSSAPEGYLGPIQALDTDYSAPSSPGSDYEAPISHNEVAKTDSKSSKPDDTYGSPSKDRQDTPAENEYISPAEPSKEADTGYLAPSTSSKNPIVPPTEYDAPQSDYVGQLPREDDYSSPQVSKEVESEYRVPDVDSSGKTPVLETEYGAPSDEGTIVQESQPTYGETNRETLADDYVAPPGENKNLASYKENGQSNEKITETRPDYLAPGDKSTKDPSAVNGYLPPSESGRPSEPKAPGDSYAGPAPEDLSIYKTGEEDSELNEDNLGAYGSDNDSSSSNNDIGTYSAQTFADIPVYMPQWGNSRANRRQELTRRRLSPPASEGVRRGRKGGQNKKRNNSRINKNHKGIRDLSRFLPLPTAKAMRSNPRVRSVHPYFYV